MRASAVRCGQRDRSQPPQQPEYLPLGHLLARGPGSGRRGRRFKSGHPDQLRGPIPDRYKASFYVGPPKRPPIYPRLGGG
jgi:hypothetical protein